MSSSYYRVEAAHPFGSGLRDTAIQSVVRALDARYKQRIRGVVVRRNVSYENDVNSCVAAEIVIINSEPNLRALRGLASSMDVSGRLAVIGPGRTFRVALTSATTGETLAVVAMPLDAYKSVERAATLQQMFIGSPGQDDGSCVCAIIDANHVDQLRDVIDLT